MWSLDDNDNEVALLAKGNHSTQDGGYAIEVHLAVGTRYMVYAPEGVNPDVDICWAAFSAPRSVAPAADGDTDDDGVLDLDDACDEAGGSVRPDGCPDVDRVLTEVEYADGVLSGVVQVEDSSVTGCSGADEVEVRSGDTVVASGAVAARTGVFGVSVRLVDNPYYALVLEERLDPAAGWCGAAGAPLAFVVDTDGDEVRDSEDACDELDGKRDKDPVFSGCPTLPRTITASSPTARSASDVSAGSGACQQPQSIPVFRVPTRAPAGTCRDADGSRREAFSVSMTYRWRRGLPSGRRASSTEGAGGSAVTFRLRSRFPATATAWTAGWIGVPTLTGKTPSSRCPTLERTVTATLADAEVAGLVSTPGGPRRVGARLGGGGVGSGRHGAPGGRLRVRGGRDLPAGLAGFRDALPGHRGRGLDPSGLGVCDEATSVAVEIPRDSDGVDGDLDHCPDVDGSPTDPDFAGPDAGADRDGGVPDRERRPGLDHGAGPLCLVRTRPRRGRA